MKIDKKNVIIDAIVILCTFAFSWFVKYEITSPSAFSATEKSTDYELSDLYASVGQRSAVHYLSKDIVIVSVDHCSRNQIASIIDAVNYMEPKVIGLDIMFIDSIVGDDKLVSAILGCENIVLPIEVKRKGHSGLFEIKDSSYFYNSIAEKQLGVINLAGYSQRSVIRKFAPSFKLENCSLDNFASAIVKYYSLGEYNRLIAKGQELLNIHYHAIDYNVVKWNEVITTGTDPEPKLDLMNVIKGKIVLIGHINNDNDIHLTPISDETPGIMIHAATINTILSNNYIDNSATALDYLIAFIVTLAFVMLMSYAKMHMSNMGNLLVRICQLGLLLIMFIIGTILYISYNYYLDFSLSLLMIGLSALFFDIVYGIYGAYNLIKNK